MPRKSKLTAEEIEAADMAADDKRYHRGNGFSLMSIRDRGWTNIIDKAGSREVAFLWHTNRQGADGEAVRFIPPGQFVLEFRNKQGKPETLAFDAEDFQKWLRWV